MSRWMKRRRRRARLSAARLAELRADLDERTRAAPQKRPTPPAFERDPRMWYAPPGVERSSPGPRRDYIRELTELVRRAGAEPYLIPPPDLQARTGCTCRWPDGYPGSPELVEDCPNHGREARPGLWTRRTPAAPTPENR